jgi:hypothetical protein
MPYLGAISLAIADGSHYLPVEVKPCGENQFLEAGPNERSPA